MGSGFSLGKTKSCAESARIDNIASIWNEETKYWLLVEQGKSLDFNIFFQKTQPPTESGAERSTRLENGSGFRTKKQVTANWLKRENGRYNLRVDYYIIYSIAYTVEKSIKTEEHNETEVCQLCKIRGKGYKIRIEGSICWVR